MVEDEQTSSGFSGSLDSREDINNLPFEYSNFHSNQESLQISKTLLQEDNQEVLSPSYIDANCFGGLSNYIYNVPFNYDEVKSKPKDNLNAVDTESQQILKKKSETTISLYKESFLDSLPLPKENQQDKTQSRERNRRPDEDDFLNDEFYFADCMTCGNSIDFNLENDDVNSTDENNQDNLISEASTPNDDIPSESLDDVGTVTKFNIFNSSSPDIDNLLSAIDNSSTCFNSHSSVFYEFHNRETHVATNENVKSSPLISNNERSRSCLIDYRSYKRTPLTRVTFADSKGFALENIRYLTPPNDHLSPIMIMESLNDKVETLFRQSRPRRILTPMFDQPNASPTFIQRVLKNTVQLEYAFSNCLSLYGSVRIKNQEFEKNIFVRYTIDNWKTFRDLKATYSYHHDDNDTDSFSFYYNFTMWSANLKRIEFAVCYKHTNGHEIWDNNFGKNYALVCKFT
ncbi:hypothetical protein GJ496_007191 [Pomphorhynchus laevis]|nr:hypothetical protein GJ496_007191 [Pomphorhynchus laevis]